MEDGDYKRVVRKPCRVCGRQFVPESLVKHEAACVKLNKYDKKKKVFDSAKQRGGEGSDVSYKQIKAAQKKTVEAPRTNWRAKHTDFINTIRAARGVTRAMERGDPLPPPPPPSLNPDYVQCPYCSRRFNEKAAERHINFCKEQQQRLPNKPKPNPNAAAKMAVRTQYQPPKPKTRSPAGGMDTRSSPGYSPAGAGSRAPAARPGVGRSPQGASNGYGRQPATRGRSTTGYQDIESTNGEMIPLNHRPSSCKNVSFTNGLPPKPLNTRQQEHGLTNGYRGNEKETTLRRQVTQKAKLPPSGWISTDSANQRGLPSRVGQDLLGKLDLSMVLEEDSEPGLWAKAVAHKRKFSKAGSDYGEDSDFPGLDNNSGIVLRTGRDGRAYSEAKKEIKNGLKNKSQYIRGGTKGLESGSPSGMFYSGFPRDSESGYYSNSPDHEHYSINSHAKTSVVNPEPFGSSSHAAGGAKFCHECGSRFPLPSAKFCCECGVRRMGFT